MSDEIKLNEWRYGTIPELHPYASIKLGGLGKIPVQNFRPIEYQALGEIDRRHYTQWYAVLSTEPPKMPEPELRLPDGWDVYQDEAVQRWGVPTKEWTVCVDKYVDGNMTDSYTFYRPTRRECVEEINRILEGK